MNGLAGRGTGKMQDVGDCAAEFEQFSGMWFGDFIFLIFFIYSEICSLIKYCISSSMIHRKCPLHILHVSLFSV